MISDASTLSGVIDEACAQPRYAMDTEFHRERTYFPKLALVQIAWPGTLVLIDPLAVDIEPLARLLRSEALAVMHAAGQDVEVLCHACGTHPGEIFDTQIAAGFLGLSTPSLATLHDRYLRTKLPKGDRMTNWLERPLTPSQTEYAASDVARLLELADLLDEQLDERKRGEWARVECELLLDKGCALREPDDAWLRIKEARNLDGAALGAVQAIAAWRERRAADIDVPVRHVMSDMAIVSLARLRPGDAEEMRAARGFDPRSLKKGMRAELCRVITEGAAAEPRPKPEPVPKLDRLRPAASLLAAWLAQRARELELDPALLGTRTDVERLLGGSAKSRLAAGWRRDLVGEPIARLVAGEASIAFDGDSLALEARSNEPL